MGDNRDGDESEWRTPEETARLRDEAFARLMSLPPKPQKDMKLGKPRGRQKGGSEHEGSADVPVGGRG